MKKQPKASPHVVSIHPDKVGEATRKMRKHKTGNTDFRNYVFLTSFYRNRCNVKNVGHGKLARRIGIHPQHVRASLARLEWYGLTRLYTDDNSEKTKVDWIMTEEGGKTIQLRLGPKQYACWRKIKGALRTFLVLATFADSNRRIDTGGLALADLICKETSVCRGTAMRHVKVLKENRVLHSVKASGLRTNQRAWFLDDFMVRIEET